ncbi:hypothetical protein, partial [Priestia taiwanensis]
MIGFYDMDEEQRLQYEYERVMPTPQLPNINMQDGMMPQQGMPGMMPQQGMPGMMPQQGMPGMMP